MTNAPTYYRCDAETGELRGPRTPQIDPLETQRSGRMVYAQPGRHDITVPPPQFGPGMRPVWRDGAWQIMPDHRGETWWRAHDQPVLIDALGDPAALGLVANQPPAPILPPTSADVRAECSRRMQKAAGARDEAHLSILISNGIREAQTLQNQRLVQGRPWTAEQTRRAAELARASDMLDRIRAASNAMETAPPADYAADHRWPAMTAPSDDEHRAVASEAVQSAARFVRERLLSDQIRWEIAIRARNGSAADMAKLDAEAKARGITIEALVDGVIEARGMIEDGTAALNAIEVQAIREVETASGDGIWAALGRGIARINGD